MRTTILLSLLALTLMAAGCSSSSQPAAAVYHRSGTLATKWGELPTYSPSPGPASIRVERPDANLSGEAVIDLLIDRNGRVQDWDIVSSPDDASFQRGVSVWLRDFRIGPHLDAGDPAPYALRVTFAFVAPGANRDQYHQTPGQTGPW